MTRSRFVVWVAPLVGAALVGITLRVPRGSAAFHIAGYLLAAVWVAAALLGRDAARRTSAERPLGAQIAVGVAAALVSFGGFVAGAAVGRRIDLLEAPIDSLLLRADAGPVAAVLAIALVNAVAEEMYFRGLLIERTAHLGATISGGVAVVVYVAVTAVAGNAALVVASLVMGVVFTLVRQWGGGLAAPVVTHAVWSTLMLVALPR